MQRTMKLYRLQEVCDGQVMQPERGLLGKNLLNGSCKLPQPPPQVTFGRWGDQDCFSLLPSFLPLSSSEF